MRARQLKRSGIFGDLAEMAGGAVSLADGMRQNIREEIRLRVQELADKLDFVPREDFDHLEAQLTKAQEELTDIHKRLEKLEKKKT